MIIWTLNHEHMSSHPCNRNHIMNRLSIRLSTMWACSYSRACCQKIRTTHFKFLLDRVNCSPIKLLSCTELLCRLFWILFGHLLSNAGKAGARTRNSRYSAVYSIILFYSILEWDHLYDYLSIDWNTQFNWVVLWKLTLSIACVLYFIGFNWLIDQ